MEQKRTTAAIDPETWKALEALHTETRMSKKALIRLSVMHLADCEDARKGLALLGYDSEAIARIVRDSCELSLVTPLLG